MTDTEDMVDRAARAIDAENERHLAEWGVSLPRLVRLAVARVVIASMRDPTAAMIVAGLQHEGTDLASEYRAMIDEALSPSKGTEG